MVGVDLEMPTIKVRMKVFHSEGYGQSFLVQLGIVFLLLGLEF